VSTRGSRHDDDTKPFELHGLGNELYHRAMFAIGMHGYAVTTVLKDSLRIIGATPGSLSIDDLGVMLPEIERRLRLLAPPDEVAGAMQRLRRLMFEWFEEQEREAVVEPPAPRPRRIDESDDGGETL
jgi:hypothetical protein